MRSVAQRFVSVHTGRYVVVGGNHLCRAVFAARPFHAGAVIMRFGGSAMRGSKVPQAHTGTADRFMQIDHNFYLGPSGGVDDFVNHSCDPNTGVKFADYAIILVALRPIAKGEEISWDYSTTMHDNKWLMKCECRAPACRALVGEFASLPHARRAYYLSAGVVAPYIVRALEGRQERTAEAARPIAPRGGLADLQRRVQDFVQELSGKRTAPR